MFRGCMHAQLLQSCPTLCNPMDCRLPGSSVHGNSPGQNTGVGCHALLQGVLPTQESNPSLLCLLPGQVGSLPLAPCGKPCLLCKSLLGPEPWASTCQEEMLPFRWKRLFFYRSSMSQPAGYCRREHLSPTLVNP